MDLYFDESGYTGHNLLDPKQPIFSLASTCVSNEDAHRILTSSFPKYQGEEFKFTNVWRSSGGRKGLRSFFDQVLDRHNDFFVWAADKRYMAFTKMVDSLIEPIVYNNGFDFYANAYGRKLVNHFYFGFERFDSHANRNALIESYHLFANAPSKDSLVSLTTTVSSVKDLVGIELQKYMGLLLQGAVRFEEFSKIELQDGSNEFQFTAMLSSVGFWHRKRAGQFQLLHDHSSDFMRQADLWKRLTSPDVEPQILATADGLGLKFPLRIGRTQSVDSKVYYSVQLVDVLAGLTTKILNRANEPHRTLLEDLMYGNKNDIHFDGTMPKMEAPTKGPKLRTGPDTVDQFIGITKP